MTVWQLWRRAEPITTWYVEDVPLGSHSSQGPGFKSWLHDLLALHPCPDPLISVHHFPALAGILIVANLIMLFWLDVLMQLSIWHSAWHRPGGYYVPLLFESLVTVVVDGGVIIWKTRLGLKTIRLYQKIAVITNFTYSAVSCHQSSTQ